MPKSGFNFLTMSDHSIQFICSDIDGTLLDKNRQLSIKTRAVIKALKDIYPVVLISSRMPKSLRLLMDELETQNYPLIAYNGSLVQTREKTIFSQEIEFEVLQGMVKFANQIELHLSLYHADEWWVPQNDQWSTHETNSTRVHPEIRPLIDTLIDWGKRKLSAHKVMCMGQANKIDQMQAFLKQNFPKEVNAYRSKDTYLEVSHIQQDKASALALLIDQYYPHISMQNVVAFGDNYNDETLIQDVGYGVAVANAKSNILTTAPFKTRSNIEDGVALFLEKKLL